MAIDETRPFEPLGMTTAKWADVPVVDVDLASLTWSQQHVSVSGLLAHVVDGIAGVGGDRFPHVVEWQGRRYVSDGHHRLLVAAIRGARRARARLLVATAEAAA